MDLSLDTVIAGDLNIDRCRKNNPEQRSDLKEIIPLLEDFLAENNIVQINSRTTRHRIGERASTLDIFLTNIPENCSNWKTLKT